MNVIYLRKHIHLNPVAKLILNPWVILCWFLFLMISYFFLDEILARFLELHATLVLHSVAKLFTQFGEGGPYVLLFAFLYLFYRYKLKAKRIAGEWLYLLMTVVVSGLACLLLKFFLGRARPIELFNHDVYGFYFFKTHYAWVSFPSGHATTAAAVAMGLSLLWPRYWKICFVAAILVALSRVVLDVHYLSDVMAGFYLGAVIALWLAKIFERWIIFPKTYSNKFQTQY